MIDPTKSLYQELQPIGRCIHSLKALIEATADPIEVKKLQKQLKQLQWQALFYLEKIEFRTKKGLNGEHMFGIIRRNTCSFLEVSIFKLVYRFRLYPTKEQERQMFYTLKLCRKLYNYSLAEREETYKATGKRVTYKQQQKNLPVYVNENPEYRKIHSQVLQDVLRRLDNSFKRYFGKLSGYPRYKNRDHYISFTYPQVDAVKRTFSKPGMIYLSRIGYIKMKAHRDFLASQVSRANIKYHGGQWHANLTIEVPNETCKLTGKAVGIDLGLTSFAVFSDGTVIDNPRHLRHSENKIAKAQRKFSRKKKGSHNQGKAKAKLRRAYIKIANQRKDFLHKTSATIVKGFDFVVTEKLRINNMVRYGNLSKSIYDASWRRFLDYIAYKCERWGKQLILVDPKNTSQYCICGKPVPKTLGDRIHNCPYCGLVMDRDHISAKLILERGLKLSA